MKPIAFTTTKSAGKDRWNASRLSQCAVLIALGCILAPFTAGAQQSSTASKRLHLQAFGMLSYVRPDFGGALKNAGGAVGVDADVSLPRLSRLDAGLEFRAIGSGGRVSNQYAESFGPRLVYNIGAFHPYGDFLIGAGQIHYDLLPIPADPKYNGDNSLVYTYGGGVDWSIARYWAIRADAQQQRWNVGTIFPTFHPDQFSLGIRYELHFRNRFGPY